MLQQWIHSLWFWPLLGTLLLAYYAWVFWAYFRPGFKLTDGSLSKAFTGGSGKQLGPTTKISLSYKDLEVGFQVQEKLLRNPESELSSEELTLLQSSPFGELIRKSSNT